jgi:hypothetical protein
MTTEELQLILGVVGDGVWGPASKAALLSKFTHPHAPALTDADFAAAAERLGCSPAQIRAVRVVEAAGSGFDGQGMPRMLFERHKFHGFTGGRFSPAPFSLAERGGYEVSSWAKLNSAIAALAGAGLAVDAAFMAASWGAFQVMGQYWHELNYASPFSLAIATVAGEAAQLDLMVRFIQRFGLEDELRRLSSNPVSCAAFAAAYNGPAFRANRYDQKLAAAMAG